MDNQARTKKVKTSELEGAELDWAVAIADASSLTMDAYTFKTFTMFYKPSTDWACGGPLIERECITIFKEYCGWEAYIGAYQTYDGLEGVVSAAGATPLVAAMRAFVASKIGYDVEVPA